MYAEDLAQTQRRPVIVALDTVIPYQPCLVDSVGCLVFWSSLALSTLLFFYRVPQALPNVFLSVSTSTPISCCMTPL